MKWRVLFLSGLAMCSHAFAKEQIITTCSLGNNRVKLVRSQPIYDTHQYAIRTGNSAPVLIFGDEEHSRGSSVKQHCIGHNNRILILSGEFTANALEGIAYFYDHQTNQLASIRFAERTRPRWAYIGTSDLLLVFLNGDHGESDSKYTIYRYLRGQEPEISYSNLRPYEEKLRLISIQ